MKILKQLFIDHPASVGETYVEHAFHAAKFGAAMLLGKRVAVAPGLLWSRHE